MYAVGIDIGTTNIAGVLLDLGGGSALRTLTVRNDSEVLRSGQTFGERVFFEQDLGVITERTLALLGRLTKGIETAKIASIGFTGQMHGVVYLGGDRKPLSPLVTWQDRRGNLRYKGRKTYAEYATEAAGQRLSTGYGAVTYFYDNENGLVPDGTAAIATVYDYVAGVVAGGAGGARNVAHASSAASIGLFDLWANRFDREAINALGLDPAFFPEIAQEYAVIGEAAGNIPVTVGIGDNQAGFIGAVRDFERSALVNAGTGSQVSVMTDKIFGSSSFETRPFTDGKYLAVGSALCGGKSLDVLAGLINDIASKAGCEGVDAYELITKAAGSAAASASSGGRPLKVDTRFYGSRKSPMKRGSITNITGGNLTLESLALGFCEGISRELSSLYKEISAFAGKRPVIVGSGGAIRKNPALGGFIARDFDAKVTVPPIEEEAAVGAALYGACGAGLFKTAAQASKAFFK
ncbi:MAG: hypothetical protein K6B54_08030 [Clostridia bacterium]|nr:hypothetical protein [Clostridia bacterium]